MSNRRICDFCNNEMEPPESRLTAEATGPERAQATIVVYASKLTQAHDICRYCIIDAVRGMDDRSAE